MKILLFIFTVLFSLFTMSQEFEMLRVEPYHNTNEELAWPNSVFYSVFLQSFYDANGDGIGDINGLRKKLDYLQELGIGAIWLLPVHPSPTYHKYDVSDYYSIHPDYGTMEDFKKLLNEAHARNIKVLIDLVVNHTSDQISWFQEALQGDKKYMDYYVWTNDTDMIKAEKNHWHQPKKSTSALVKDKMYYGFFWHEMPDLNFDNPEVREEIKKIGEFWLDEVGVDGFRLDAIRFIYPEGEKEKNHIWWREFRAAMNKVNPDFFMVAEIWGEDTIVAPFLKNGVHAGFNFDVSFRLLESLKDSQDKGVVEKVMESRAIYKKTDPGFYDAIFLTNHDQNRILSEMEGKHDLAKVAASILLTLPGSPFIYYGEEIGMLGKKPDEHIREPFLWDLPGKDPGQTHWIEPEFSSHQTVPPLKIQQKVSNSMYQHYASLISLRKNSDALKIGDIRKVTQPDKGIIAYERYWNNERILVLNNITDEGKLVELPKEFMGFSKLVFSTMDKVQKKGLKIFLEKYSTIILTY